MRHLGAKPPCALQVVYEPETAPGRSSGLWTLPRTRANRSSRPARQMVGPPAAAPAVSLVVARSRMSAPPPTARQPFVKPGSVFVVLGVDVGSREKVQLVLRRHGQPLNPANASLQVWLGRTLASSRRAVTCKTDMAGEPRAAAMRMTAFCPAPLAATTIKRVHHQGFLTRHLGPSWTLIAW
jgi:hypothetical protein